MATTRGPLPVEDVLRVNGSRRFAAALAAASPFASLADALLAARRIWLNEVDVNGWLEAFAAHPAIGTTSSSAPKWCKEEQSAALATATDSTAQVLQLSLPSFSCMFYSTCRLNMLLFTCCRSWQIGMPGIGRSLGLCS